MSNRHQCAQTIHTHAYLRWQRTTNLISNTLAFCNSYSGIIILLSRRNDEEEGERIQTAYAHKMSHRGSHKKRSTTLITVSLFDFDILFSFFGSHSYPMDFFQYFRWNFDKWLWWNFMFLFRTRSENKLKRIDWKWNIVIRKKKRIRSRNGWEETNRIPNLQVNHKFYFTSLFLSFSFLFRSTTNTIDFAIYSLIDWLLFYAIGHLYGEPSLQQNSRPADKFVLIQVPLQSWTKR